jgi:hypothetical protein
MEVTRGSRYPRGVQHPALLFVIPVFVILFFGGLWCGISLLLSRVGGWSGLAERFPAPEQPEGKRFRSQSGRLGLVNYNRCLTIYISKGGLYLSMTPLFRVGHRPMLIPWKEIHDVETQQVLWAEFVSFQIGSPTMATLRLSKTMFDQARSLLE